MWLYVKSLGGKERASTKDVRIFSVIFEPPTSCPNLSLFGWSPSPLYVRTKTLNIIANFSAKHFHLHHPSLYTNTKKVIHVKYLLTTLIQNNIYLKISHGNRQNIFCFEEPIYCPAWAHQHTLLTLNVGFQVLCNLIKIWDNIH